MQRNLLAKTSSTVRSKSGTLGKFLIVPASVNGTNGIHHYYNNNFVATQFRCGHTSNKTSIDSIVARVSGKARQFHRGIVNEFSSEEESSSSSSSAAAASPEEMNQQNTEEQEGEQEEKFEQGVEGVEEEVEGVEEEEEEGQEAEEEEDEDVHDEVHGMNAELLKGLTTQLRKNQSIAVIEKVEAQPDYEQYPILTALRTSAKAKLGKIDEAIEDAFHFSEKQREDGSKKWDTNFNMLLSTLSLWKTGSRDGRRHQLISTPDLHQLATRIDELFAKNEIPRSKAIYHAFIRCSNSVRRVKLYMDEMQEKNIIPWNNTSLRATMAYVLANEPELAFPLARRLIEKDVPVPATILDKLFLQITTNPTLSSQGEVMAKIFVKKIRFHGTTSRLGNMYESLLSNMLDGAASVGNFDLAEKTWRLMAESKIPHMNHHFHAIFEAYARGRQYQAAINTLKEMIARNLTLHIPSLEILGKVISSSLEEIDACYYDITSMIEKGDNVPVDALNLIIYACSLARDVDRGFATFAELERFKMKPNVNTYNYMISLCQRQFPTSMKLFEEMNTQEILPNEQTFTALIQSALGARNIVKAIEFAKNIPADVVIDPYKVFSRLLITAHKMRRSDLIADIEELFGRYNARPPTVDLERYFSRNGENRRQSFRQDREQEDHQEDGEGEEEDNKEFHQQQE